MKQAAFSTLALVVSSLAYGCAAPGEDNAPAESDSVQQQTQDLTLSECAAQRDTCFSKNPLFGVFTCPAQYTQCSATASNGLPAEVSSAIADAADCTSAALKCVNGANSVTKTAVCTENEAQCVAAIVDVDLPNVVEGTAACVDASVSCINKARSVSDLANCATSLSGCAVEQVQAVIPAEVGQVVGEVNTCRTELDGCIAAAANATALAACSEDSAVCVADTLHVTLPNVPVSKVVDCAETAATCALHVSSVRDVSACATALSSCAGNVVGSVELPKPLTCEQKWTACMASNPLNFFKCSSALNSCQD
ncbi:MAG: hypothetical protein JWN48_36 [Myxococcaceae bacterium]|nr:hypothetical protein [Myxococcaceae bacterium]